MALVKRVGGAAMPAVDEDRAASAARMVLLGRAAEWLAGEAAAGAPDTAAAAYLQVCAVL